MITKTICTSTVLFIALLLTGCQSDLPDCNSPEALSALRQILIGERGNIGAQKAAKLSSFLNIDQIVDEGRSGNKRTCSAHVSITQSALAVLEKTSSDFKMTDKLMQMFGAMTGAKAELDMNQLQINYEIVPTEDSNESSALVRVRSLDPSKVMYFKSAFDMLQGAPDGNNPQEEQNAASNADTAGTAPSPSGDTTQTDATTSSDSGEAAVGTDKPQSDNGVAEISKPSSASAQADSADPCQRFDDTGTEDELRACSLQTISGANAVLRNELGRVLGDARKIDASSQGTPGVYESIVKDQRNWNIWYASACQYNWAIPDIGELGRDYAGPACLEGQLKTRMKYLKDVDDMLKNPHG